jgi:hypothetical protein
MMKILKKPLNLIALATLFIFAGCFELIEEMTLNDNGSGTYKLTYDMSASKDMINMMRSFTAGTEDDITTSFGGFDEGLDDIEAKPGISNAEVIADSVNYVFSLKFDFDSISSLNDVLAEILSDENGSGVAAFTYSGNELVRNHDSDMKSMLIDDEEDDPRFEEMMMLQYKDVSFTTIYHFNKRVRNVSNDLAEIKNNGRTVEMKLYLFRPEFADKTFENRIRF